MSLAGWGEDEALVLGKEVLLRPGGGANGKNPTACVERFVVCDSKSMIAQYNMLPAKDWREEVAKLSLNKRVHTDLPLQYDPEQEYSCLL